MSEVLAGFPDAEEVGMALMAPLGATCQTTPPTIEVKTIQVIRVGGADDGITDSPLLHFAFYGVGDTGYQQAKEMAEDGRQIILAAGGTAVVVNGVPVLIDSTRTATSPVEAAQDNPELRRKVATFRLTYRRPRA